MILIRLSKVALIAALAAFALIVAYDNILDYGSNYEFVRHVLIMDTTFPGSALMHRAITGETIWTAAYALIIASEAVDRPSPRVRRIGVARAAEVAGRDLQPRESLGRRRTDPRLWALVFRLPRDRRRIFRHVAVERLERAGGCVPNSRGHSRGADFRQPTDSDRV